MDFVHIAGTNGKGSTAQYLFDIMSQCRRCGLFTSPHILSVLERFRINGRTMTQDEYDEYLALVPPEEGEHMFCRWFRMAKKWFEDQEVEVAVIETGMGGKSDCTNEIYSPMQIITSIDYDHVELLGSTLTAIAQEKSGIIKYGGMTICQKQQPEAMRVVRRTCARLDASLFVLRDRDIHVKHAGLDGQTFDFNYDDRRYQGLHISAVSPVQVDNACTAVMAAHHMNVDEASIKAGLEKTQLPARVQVKGDVIIDGAHNVAAVEELKSTLEKYFADRKIIVLVALMGDKDIMHITETVSQFADFVVTTCADKRRGVSARELAMYFGTAKAVEDPAYAFDYAHTVARQKKGILVVCGSFYLAPYALAESQ